MTLTAHLLHIEAAIRAAFGPGADGVARALLVLLACLPARLRPVSRQESDSADEGESDDTVILIRYLYPIPPPLAAAQPGRLRAPARLPARAPPRPRASPPRRPAAPGPRRIRIGPAPEICDHGRSVLLTTWNAPCPTPRFSPPSPPPCRS